jgi:SAM-dependent methyltransferase
VDVVCDLTCTNPFRPASFEAILLLNVLEHVYDTHALLDRLAGLLKPDGVLLVAIPFMVKLHQVPVDFVRYTHFALAHLAEQHGLLVEHLEGYYDPVFFLGEGIGNLHNAILPGLSGSQKQRSRVLIKGLRFLANQLQHTLGPGEVGDPAKARSLAPTGYQVVYRKYVNNTK